MLVRRTHCIPFLSVSALFLGVGFWDPDMLSSPPDAKPPSGCRKDPRGGRPCGFPDTLAGGARTERESGSLRFYRYVPNNP